MIEEARHSKHKNEWSDFLLARQCDGQQQPINNLLFFNIEK
jgi:hypothetical protein